MSAVTKSKVLARPAEERERPWSPAATATPPALPGMSALAGLPGPVRDPGTIEDGRRRTLEVVAIWKGTVQDVRHLAERHPTYTIGEEPGCDFHVSPESLGGETRLVLARQEKARGSVLRHPAFDDGEILLSSGERMRLGDAAAGGETTIPEDARARIEVGGVTFLVSSVPIPRKPRLPIKFEWDFHSANGASIAAILAFLFLVFFFPPSSRALSLEEMAQSSIYHRILFDPSEILPAAELPAWMTKQPRDDEKEGGTGKRHKGDEGQMGDPKAKKSDMMYGIKGPEKNPDPHMARDQQKSLAKGVGILSVLTQTLNMPTSPFGRDEALGNDAESALGALMGSQLGPNFGLGGLGMIGTGSGGGGTGEGTIGLGAWGKIGHGAGPGSGVGYGPGPGGLHDHGPGKVPPPKITGKAEVKGSLSQEAIRRVIRQHVNEVKFCYEQGLASEPDLSGRVTITFIISPAGSVQTSTVSGSTLGNDGVEKCIAKAVARWTFPSPEDGGVVLVKYPFMLQPAGGN